MSQAIFTKIALVSNRNKKNFQFLFLNSGEKTIIFNNLKDGLDILLDLKKNKKINHSEKLDLITALLQTHLPLAPLVILDEDGNVIESRTALLSNFQEVLNIFYAEMRISKNIEINKKIKK